MKQVEIKKSVFISEKYRLAPIAAIGDMVRAVHGDDSLNIRHFRPPKIDSWDETIIPGIFLIRNSVTDRISM